MGLLVLGGVFVGSIQTDLNTAEKHFSDTISYIKEQCTGYDNLNLASETKSLMRVMENVQHLCSDIERERELYDSFVLDDAAVAQYLRSYTITAAANLKTLLANKDQHVVGRIQIPNIPACDGALYISGDSMYPILKSGDVVGFKEVNSFSSVIYGEMYLVSFCIDGDEYLSVKYVNRSDVEGCIKLVSYNPHHEPMDIPLASIQAMAIVKFSIRRNMMM